MPCQIRKYTKCFSYPLSFYATQIVNPFINTRISANHDKVDELSANGVILVGDCFSSLESLLN